MGWSRACGVCTAEGEREMYRTADSAPGNVRVAFWGCTNSCGITAVLALARQLRACEAALGCHAEITRFFYDTPEPVNDLMILAVRGAGGPSQWDGDWDQLAAALPDVDRGFDAIICESLDRVGRNSMRVLRRERLVAEHGATILSANEPLPQLPKFVATTSDRLRRRITTSLGEDSYAMARALLGRVKVRNDGG
jgi:hypothetical protein